MVVGGAYTLGPRVVELASLDHAVRDSKPGHESISHPHLQHPEERAGDGRQHAIGGEIVKWKDIYSLVEVAIDRCEDVANIVETILVKHS